MYKLWIRKEKFGLAYRGVRGKLKKGSKCFHRFMASFIIPVLAYYFSLASLQSFIFEHPVDR